MEDIDLVAELLKHLNIKHVAMASHSCGTMYLFNMILVHRYLLHPKHPFVVFLGISSLPTYPNRLPAGKTNWKYAT